MKHNLMNQKTSQAVLCAALCAPLLLALAAGCAGCNISPGQDKAPSDGNSIAIMTWNAQTLFDGVENGTEYDDYRESAGWTGEKYRGRLNVIASAIGGMARKPDVIALQEIESAQVMADLAAALSALGYRWTHFAIIPGMSLGVGLLSRFPLDGARSHSVYIDGEIAPRPMLEARVNTEDGPLALFVCHWKSKLGDDDATESTRRASARIIVRRLRELAASEPYLPAIIMGDLNENHDEFYRRSGTVISALLPDDPRAAEFANLYGLDDSGPNAAAAAVADLQKDFIVISKGKPPEARYFPSQAVTLYSPWAVELEDGSYYYRNEWETIDHFLLSPQLFIGAGWNFENCEVINYPPYANASGRPVAYNPRTGNGLSDHLPLMLFLKKRE
ncbi:MAG: endonuclease/exonuclease/phosphatase family protein [Treponema sp.]|jgi:endonuclease/exonuclease/phosphatase family metal-dependent hydrolase|nr:endonuclease/exonuclease/phosphatase family protein [Treponema sp.]